MYGNLIEVTFPWNHGQWSIVGRDVRLGPWGVLLLRAWGLSQRQESHRALYTHTHSYTSSRFNDREVLFRVRDEKKERENEAKLRDDINERNPENNIQKLFTSKRHEIRWAECVKIFVLAPENIREILLTRV